MVKNFVKSGNIGGEVEKDFFGHVKTPWKQITLIADRPLRGRDRTQSPKPKRKATRGRKGSGIRLCRTCPIPPKPLLIVSDIIQSILHQWQRKPLQQTSSHRRLQLRVRTDVAQRPALRPFRLAQLLQAQRVAPDKHHRGPRGLMGLRYKTKTKMQEIKALERELVRSESAKLQEKADYVSLIRESEMQRLVDRHGLGLTFPEQPPVHAELRRMRRPSRKNRRHDFQKEKQQDQHTDALHDDFHRAAAHLIRSYIQTL